MTTNLATLTTDYQNALEAFRQRPDDDDTANHLHQAQAALETAYLETIPTLPPAPELQPEPPAIRLPKRPLLAVASLLVYVAARLARKVDSGL